MPEQEEVLKVMSAVAGTGLGFQTTIAPQNSGDTGENGGTPPPDSGEGESTPAPDSGESGGTPPPNSGESGGTPPPPQQ